MVFELFERYAEGNDVAAIRMTGQYAGASLVIGGADNNRVGAPEQCMQERLEQRSEHFLTDRVAMVGDHDLSLGPAGKIGEYGHRMGKVQMNNVRLGRPNLLHQSRTERCGSEGEVCSYARDVDAVEHFVDRLAVVIGNQHLKVDRFVQFPAKGLEMGFNSSHVGRIELADVQNAHFAVRAAVRR